MSFKHLILVALILMVFIAPACASEHINYSNQSTNITFEGVEFVIPVGFGESKDVQNFDDLGSQGKTTFYVNEYGGEIIITVASDWLGMSIDDLYKEGASKTRINGHEGWNYTEGNLTYFSYVDGDSGIIVGVTNQTRLSEVII